MGHIPDAVRDIYYSHNQANSFFESTLFVVVVVGIVVRRVIDGDGGETLTLGHEEQEALLLPMAFSLKMRELMVWTTGTVLPAIAGESTDMELLGQGTPGESCRSYVRVRAYWCPHLQRRKQDVE